MSLDEFIDDLITNEKNRESLRHHQTIPARNPSYLNLSDSLSPEVEEILKKQGIDKLFSHQVEAIEEIRQGKDVMILTGTASGKSLIYSIPIIEEIVKQKSTRVICLYPTKALAQDQLRIFHLYGSPLVPATYDGDSKPQHKVWARQQSNLILTNPDMLHQGILPNHNLWGDFLLNLRFVVIDEAHVLKGVFGSNVGLIIRRLKRLCEHYGSSPQFILSSATLSNPGNFADNLIGREVTVIDKDGSPRGAKEFFLWNPPIADKLLGIRKSANYEAARLFSKLLVNSVKTIAFSKSRQTAELIIKYVRQILEDKPLLAEAISSYRGGYTPEKRREIEKSLFKDKLMGVSSTNALELGVDVGGLDSIIINGFPGTISSVWQQAGRAGRGRDKSAVLMIGHEDPLDQYYINNPKYFFGKAHEEALINLNNTSILKKHLACAAYEKALKQDDFAHFGEKAKIIIDELVKEEYLKTDGKTYYWTGRGYPASQVNIRSASQNVYQIIDLVSGEVLGEVDNNNVFIYLHTGAVYLHLGETYLVERLDLDRRVALVKQEDCDYYTQTKDHTDLKIIKVLQEKKIRNFSAYFGQVEVTNRVIGFQRKNILNGSVLGSENLNLPPQTFQTEACWYVIPTERIGELDLNNYQIAGALHALEHAMIALLPVYAICDRWDLGGVSTSEHSQNGLPSIFIYDAYSGGIGLTKKGFEVGNDHLQNTRKLIKECPCQLGCPSCIQSPKCGNLNEPLDKNASIKILNLMLGQ